MAALAAGLSGSPRAACLLVSPRAAILGVRRSAAYPLVRLCQCVQRDGRGWTFATRSSTVKVPVGGAMGTERRR
jgi:Na+/serine symporter